MAPNSSLESISTQAIIITSVSAVVLWLVGRIVYNRVFHPLAHVPGPFFGSFTELYRFYYNYVRNGAFYLEFKGLRDKYGPVIRIAPDEVLLADPEHYDKLYSMTSKHHKDPDFYTLVGAPWTMFSTIGNEDHRHRRAVLNPFFSRRAVLAQEDVVQAKVTKLCDRIAADSARGIPTDFSTGTRALAVDVLTEYAFGSENCFRSLDAPDLGEWYNILMRGVTPMIYLLRVFPFLQGPMQAMPYWLAKRINPLVVGLIGAKLEAKKQIEKVVKEVDAGVIPARATIFHTILDPSDAREDYRPPPVEHIVDEAYGLTGAASDTTGNVMCVCTFHVLQNRDVRDRLRAELAAAFPDTVARLDYVTLERLPYLTAVVKEGLRLAYGVIHPLPRVVAEDGLVFNGIHIPRGSVVSMSNWLMHRDPNAFPDPDRFDPGRWLGDPEIVRYREKFLTPFSRGSRMCLGQPLAISEIYVVLGTLFRRFDNLKAHDFGLEDLAYEDYFIPFHSVKARKFRVLCS